MPEQGRIDKLIESICDFDPVDWQSVDSESLSEGERELLGALREFEAVASANFSLISTHEKRVEALCPRQLGAGDRWGHLEILGKIGAGASAEVFRARDTKLDREVALKLFHPGHESGVDKSRVIVEEGRLLGRVSHPNVVRVYGADEHDGRTGIWMELLQGQTLAEILAGKRRLSDEEASSIGIKLCHALAAVHARDLVHGDVKLQNVFREDDGRIVLMDFSATRPARALDGDDRPSTAGTPLYMAPELFAGEHPTASADIYSLGVLLYFLVAGRLPAFGVLPGEDLPPLRDLRPDVAESFLRIVERATAREKSKRYRSAGELERALRDSHPPIWSRQPVFFAASIAAAMSLVIALAPQWLYRSNLKIRSLAVLQMRNEMGESSGEEIAEATSFGVVERLAHLEEIRVLAPSAVVNLADGQSAPDVLARSLRVDGLVRGRIRRQGEDVVLFAELVDKTGATVWSERFKRSALDPTSLERQLAAALVIALGIKLSGEEANRLTEHHTASPDAYRFYRLGRHYLNRREEGALRKAIGYFEQAVKVDSTYAHAYAGLADAYTLLNVGYYRPSGDIPIHVALGRAREAAAKALELNSNLPDAHASMGMVLVMSRQPKEAETHYEAALDLSPNHLTARQWLSRFLSSQGRHEEAIRHAQVAADLDPVSPLVQRTVGFAYYDAREYDSAVEAFEAALELQEDYPFVRHSLALSHWYQGDAAEAIREFRSVKPWIGAFFEQLHEGHQREAIRLLSSNEASEPSWVVPVYYALASDYDRALDRLSRVQSSGEENASWAIREAAFDPLVGDQRFRTVVVRSGAMWRWGMSDLGE